MSSDAYTRARHLTRIGRHDDAERELRAALTTRPGDADLLTLLAYVLRQRRDYIQALRVCDAAVAADPDLADAHAERAECLTVLLRNNPAVEAAAEAVRLRPDDPAMHLVTARALAGARRYDEARSAARHAQSLAPESVEALLTLADIDRDAGNRADATRAVRAALALEPDNAYARWLLAMLDAERLHVRRSLRALHDVARDDPAHPDVIAMTWPIRSLLSALRRWFAAAILLATVAALLATTWQPAAPAARVLAASFATVVAGLAGRVLVPAGRLPWRCLGLVPRMLRLATVAQLVLLAAMVAVLSAYVATAAWWLPLAALAAVPVLWALGLAELLATRLDDPGYRQALKALAQDFRTFGTELRKWWRDTRRELREAWNDPSSPPPRQ